MASNKRNDNVFLLTLVDFLLQVIFVGLFAYALVTAIDSKKNQRDPALVALEQQLQTLNPEQVRQLLEIMTSHTDIAAALRDQRDLQALLVKQGVSDFAALTDQLSRMVPIDQLDEIKQVRELLSVAEVRQLRELLSTAGGAEQAIKVMSAYLNGVGKPHCLYAADKKNALPLATLIAYDDHIAIEAPTAELKLVLGQMGEDYPRVADLGLSDFSRVFSKLAAHYPNCTHSFRVREKTNFVYARNALSATRSIRPIFVH